MAAIDVEAEWADAEAAWAAAEAECDAAAAEPVEQPMLRPSAVVHSSPPPKRPRLSTRPARASSAATARPQPAVERRQESPPKSNLTPLPRPVKHSLPHVPLGDGLADVRGAELKEDHALRPMWVCPDGRIMLERFNRYYEKACDFLAVVAEPVWYAAFASLYAHHL